MAECRLRSPYASVPPYSTACSIYFVACRKAAAVAYITVAFDPRYHSTLGFALCHCRGELKQMIYFILCLQVHQKKVGTGGFCHIHPISACASASVQPNTSLFSFP